MEKSTLFADKESNGRVKQSTSNKINYSIDKKLLNTIEQYQYFSHDEITDRIKELDKEWDIERLLELNASSLILSGILLGSTVNKKWFALSGIVATFLLQHAVQGWCPPLPILRKLGYRSRREIDEEKFALKIVRGDFEDVSFSAKPSEILKLMRS